MSRLGDFFSNTFAQAKSHEPGWIQRLPSMPGTPQSLQDAFIANRWSHPYGSEQNSMDIFAGGVGHPAGSEHPWARTIGRAVGSYFLSRGLNNATGTNWAGPAARGVGNLFNGGGGLSGMGDGPLGGLLGGGGGNAPPVDNSMILPQPQPQQDSLSSLPPGFLTMLLANAFQQQQRPQEQDQGSMISPGGII